MDRRQLMLSAMLGLLPQAGLAEPQNREAEETMHGFSSGGAAIAVEWFAAQGSAGTRAPALLLLHGADGLTYADGYRTAAQVLAGSGYQVAFVHYLDRTGERRVNYGTLRQNFPLWTATVRDGLAWLAAQPGVDPDRLAIVGISLGAALALETAEGDRRVKAVVDYFGPLPEGLAAKTPRLPPTLILHGAQDRIVPVSNAYALETLLKQTGTPHEIQVYPGQGHGLTGAAQFDSAARVAAFLGRHLSAG